MKVMKRKWSKLKWRKPTYITVKTNKAYDVTGIMRLERLNRR